MTTLESLLAAFDVPDALVGDLVEESRCRSRAWLWMQAIAAIAHSIAAAVRADARTCIRIAVAGVAVLAAGAQSSLWLYLWTTHHVPMRGPLVSSGWFVLAWHSYSVPLHLLWCLTSILCGWTLTRLGSQRKLAFLVAAVAVQLPIVIWFTLPYVRAIVAASHPPQLLRYRLAFIVDLFAVMIEMPACTIAAALTRTKPTSD